MAPNLGQAASTTTYYDPSTATAVVTSVTGPGPTTTGSGSDSGNLGPTAVSPPLILALVALGVLSLGAAALFWWRRVRGLNLDGSVRGIRYGDAAAAGVWPPGPRRGGLGANGAGAALGKKPELFDVAVGKARCEQGTAQGWADVKVSTITSVPDIARLPPSRSHSRRLTRRTFLSHPRS
jgi:hypothetical protein